MFRRELRSILLVSQWTWILYKDRSRAHNTIPTKNPVATLHLVLPSRISTVAHVAPCSGQNSDIHADVHADGFSTCIHYIRHIRGYVKYPTEASSLCSRAYINRCFEVAVSTQRSENCHESIQCHAPSSHSEADKISPKTLHNTSGIDWHVCISLPL